MKCIALPGVVLHHKLELRGRNLCNGIIPRVGFEL
jgi:hypothetical protein